MSDWNPLIPPYENDEIRREWPRCFDCGRPYPSLSMDLKCKNCEAKAGSWVIVYVALAAVLAAGGVLAWLR